MGEKILFAILILLVVAATGCTEKQAAKNSAITINTSDLQKKPAEIQQEQPQPVEIKTYHDNTVIYKINNTSAINTTSLERKIHVLINVERVKLGLSIMDWDDHLAYIARGHSRDMGKRSYFEHEDPEGRNFAYRYNESGFKCNIIIGTTGDVQETALGGENLYLTHLEQRDWYEEKNDVRTYVRSDYYTEDEIATTTVQGWMNSTKHRENIERPYWETEGIGVAIAKDNTIYVTQNFC